MGYNEPYHNGEYNPQYDLKNQGPFFPCSVGFEEFWVPFVGCFEQNPDMGSYFVMINILKNTIHPIILEVTYPQVISEKASPIQNTQYCDGICVFCFCFVIQKNIRFQRFWGSLILRGQYSQERKCNLYPILTRSLSHTFEKYAQIKSVKLIHVPEWSGYKK